MSNQIVSVYLNKKQQAIFDAYKDEFTHQIKWYTKELVESKIRRIELEAQEK